MLVKIFFSEFLHMLVVLNCSYRSFCYLFVVCLRLIAVSLRHCVGSLFAAHIDLSAELLFKIILN